MLQTCWELGDAGAAAGQSSITRMSHSGRLLLAACLLLADTLALRVPSHARRAMPPRMLDVKPEMLGYEVPPMAKPFSDYEWDPTYPGTFKPGQREENRELDDVLEMWEGRDNPACMQLPQDQLWQVRDTLVVAFAFTRPRLTHVCCLCAILALRRFHSPRRRTFFPGSSALAC